MISDQASGRRKLTWRRVAVGSVLLSLSWTAHAAFVIADLGPSVATALNSSGQVVGYTGTPLGPQAFLYSNGSMQNLGSLDGRGSEAFDINDRGQVVGWSTSSQGAEAFVYSGGSMQGLGVQAGYQSSQATGINNSGQVVGFSYTGAPNYPAQAFLYSAGGVIQALPTLGLGNSTYPASIGSAGQVVGGAAPDGYERPFLLENGTARLLSTGAGKALGVNDSGQVVGYADSMTGSGYRAFVYSNGNLQFLGTTLKSTIRRRLWQCHQQLRSGSWTARREKGLPL